jgi:hypothetical protein
VIDTSDNPNTIPTSILALSPVGRYEYVDITFGSANVDTAIPYTVLRPENPADIRFIDITPNSVYNGATDDVAKVYRSASPSRTAWTSQAIFLRSSVANYTTRLLLFLERV